MYGSEDTTEFNGKYSYQINDFDDILYKVEDVEFSYENGVASNLYVTGNVVAKNDTKIKNCAIAGALELMDSAELTGDVVMYYMPTSCYNRNASGYKYNGQI